MSAPSDALANLRSRSEVTAPVEISTGRRLTWSVRRELWENRSVYLAPLAVAALFLVGFAIALVRLPARLRAASGLDPLQRQEVIEQPYVIAAIILMAIALIVSVVYCLDAFYGERRDRSVLFWKSMPVSDLTTVLSKASIPILVIPLVTFVVTVVTQLLMLLMSSAALASSGMGSARLWADVSFLEAVGINFVHIALFHGLWYAPLYGWLLMVSAWAKRAPFLWAVLPPVAIGAVERIAFNTSYLGGLLQRHFLGGNMDSDADVVMTMDMLTGHSLGQLLISPGLWIGLAFTAMFLFVAARLYRSRGAI